MLIGTEAYTESASSVPDVIAGVVVDPARHGKGDTVEEHITREVLVRLARHDHYSVVISLPIGHN